MRQVALRRGFTHHCRVSFLRGQAARPLCLHLLLFFSSFLLLAAPGASTLRDMAEPGKGVTAGKLAINVQKRLTRAQEKVGLSPSPAEAHMAAGPAGHGVLSETRASNFTLTPGATKKTLWRRFIHVMVLLKFLTCPHFNCELNPQREKNTSVILL